MSPLRSVFWRASDPRAPPPFDDATSCALAQASLLFVRVLFVRVVFVWVVFVRFVFGHASVVTATTP